MTIATNGKPLIEVKHCCKRFPLPEGKSEFTALDGIDITVEAGEVVALLGRSGSGKSTLLRIMAGLIPASAGEVRSGGKLLEGPNPDVAMVFQSFALLPWLTVIENVEIGLEARGVSRVERMKRALKAIDMVGLDGFESAYPKELSGGMRQRVGFARAMVVEPTVLFMDEPFSALDVLTAENLRGEIDDLWNAGSFPSKSIVLVTHNIDEAVFLADRVLVLGANPGHIRGAVKIDLPRPHDRNTERFKELVDHLYLIMTNPEMAIAPQMKPLPQVRVGAISGLLELIVEQPDLHHEVAMIGKRLRLSTDDLLPILDAGVMLKFITISEGDVDLTEVGRDFATTTILNSKEIFRRQVIENVPLITTIAATVQKRENGQISADFVLDLLRENFPEGEAQAQFETIVDWARYAELFEFDADEELLSISDPAAAE
jgi:NitT/TauT family transport system ATP-binding protein